MWRDGAVGRRERRQSKSGGYTGLHPKGNWLLQSNRTSDTAAVPAVDNPARAGTTVVNIVGRGAAITEGDPRC